MKSSALSSLEAFQNEFSRCCEQYTTLQIAVAWCGDPLRKLPFEHLRTFRGTLVATIGCAMHHTHPRAFTWLQEIGAELRVFRNDRALFHPKLYLFSRGDSFALFLGSSNLTFNGFYRNVEVNVLLEGSLAESSDVGVQNLQEEMTRWRTDAFSFAPTPAWIRQYRRKHQEIQRAAARYRVPTPPRSEVEDGLAGWLTDADWKTYHCSLLERLAEHDRDLQGYHYVLDAAANLLTTPWRIDCFKDKTCRRLMAGSGPYGWLGHVGAAGRFLRLLSRGPRPRWQVVVECMNEIAELSLPFDWIRIETILDRLMVLGLTMKVWGRLLALTRPDSLCTVASDAVRCNLSKALGISQSSLAQPEGYIRLVRSLHQAPWFNSKAPTDLDEHRVWERRVALMDGIFYEHRT